MKTEDQLYGLMAQAEDIQEHAVKLQKTALEAISALEGATHTIKKEIRFRSLLWASYGSVFLLGIGLLIFFGMMWVFTDLSLETAHLRLETAQLLEEIAVISENEETPMPIKHEEPIEQETPIQLNHEGFILPKESE